MKYPQTVPMPSAVSDWLEEQLEARGIDSVLYTRYILSLLHTHTVDVIYPDDDLQFTRLRREVRRSSNQIYNRRFHKATFTSSEWWRYAHADADQIKRSAAVDCLLSATDQNCEIESLIDELCEKLKQNNAPSEESQPFVDQSLIISTKISPQELAAKYYAAFPPLGRPVSNIEESKSESISQSSPKRNKRNCSRKSSQTKNNIERWHYEVDQELYDMNNWDFFTTDSMDMADKSIILTSEPTLNPASSSDINLDNDTYDEYFDCEDLPVDFSDLLNDDDNDNDSNNSINPTINKAPPINLNVQPQGINLTRSIWSDDSSTLFDNIRNETIDKYDVDWPDMTRQNCVNAALEMSYFINQYFDNYKDENVEDNADDEAAYEPKFKPKEIIEMSSRFTHLFLESNTTASDVLDLSTSDITPSEMYEWKKINERIDASLAQIRHCERSSLFVRVLPSLGKQLEGDKKVDNEQNSWEHCFNRPNWGQMSNDKDDLLTSERSHFKPIKEKLSINNGEYEDGATFDISTKLEEVKYKRSDSGSTLLLEQLGEFKEYRIFHDDDKGTENLLLKYIVCENNKACQVNGNIASDLDTLEYMDNNNGEAPIPQIGEEHAWKQVGLEKSMNKNKNKNVLVELTVDIDGVYDNTLDEVDWPKYFEIREKFKDPVGKTLENDEVRNIWNITEDEIASSPCLLMVRNARIEEDHSETEQLFAELNKATKMWDVESFGYLSPTVELLVMDKKDGSYQKYENNEEETEQTNLLPLWEIFGHNVSDKCPIWKMPDIPKRSTIM